MPARPCSQRLALLALLIGYLGFANIARSQTPADRELESISAWLPDTTIFYASLSDLGRHWDELENTKIFQEVIQLPDVQASLKSPQFRQINMVRQFIEGMFEQDLKELVQALSAKPAVLAIDANRHAVLVLTPSEDNYSRMQEVLSNFAALGTLGKQPGQRPVNSVKYKGIPAFSIDKARVAFYEGRIVLCTDNSIGKAVLDRALGNGEPSLADANWFREASEGLKQTAASANFLGMIDLESLRRADRLRLPRGVDMGQELLFGGIIDVVGTAPYATLTASFDANRLSVEVSAPLPDPIDPLREYFFGSGALQAVPPPLPLNGRMMSLRWYRDIGHFWNLAPQLIKDEAVLNQVSKSESEIATLLGGMTTVSDVFGYLGPKLEVVVCRPTYDTEADGAPAIVLPAFALTGQLRDPEKAEKALRLAFQQIVSFANINAGAGKYPPLELMMEKTQDYTAIAANYMQLDYMDKGDQAVANELYRNFSPTLAFRGDRFVLSSDRQLVDQIFSIPETQPAVEDDAPVDNTVVEVWPQELARIGDLNREALIAQRMLETGRDRGRAVAEIDAFLTIARCLKSMDLRLTTHHGALVLSSSVEFAGSEPVSK